MKTSSRIVIGCVATGLSQLAALAWAGGQPGAAHVLVAIAATSGVNPGETDSPNPRDEALDYLSRARQAISKGNFETAASFLERAEALNVDFGSGRVGDTPQKVRRDLDLASQAQGAEAGRTTDPFAEKGRGARETTASRGGAQRDPAKAQSDELLLDARRALAVGDARHAYELANQADALRVRYGNLDDSPEKVLKMISRYERLTSETADKESETYRKQYAELLLSQAEALMNWRDLEEADRLCEDASRLGITYNPFEVSPKSVRERIAAARQATAPRKLEPLPPTGKASRDRYATRRANDPKAQATDLVQRARQAMTAGDLRQAQALAQQAEDLRVPDAEFGPQEDRPWMVLMDIQNSRDGVQPAAAAAPLVAKGPARGDRYADSRAMYEPAKDTTRNVPAANTEQAELPISEGMDLFLQGEEALKERDIESAKTLFRQAYQHRNDLDPVTYQRLQDHLSLLTQPGNAIRQLGGNQGNQGNLDEAAAGQLVLARQVSAELARQETAARRLLEVDPKQALTILEEARDKVDQAGLDGAARDILLKRVDRGIGEVQSYIASNRSQIDLADRNRATQGELDRERQVRVDVDDRLAILVNEFNTLVDERRYEEADIVAKKATALAPEAPVVVQIRSQSKVLMRIRNEMQLASDKEQGFVDTLASVDRSSIPFDDSNPYVMPPARDWELMSNRRLSMQARERSRRSPKELEIEQRLKTPVSLKYKDAPLSVVLDNLARLAQVNLHLDQRGLAEEGVTSEMPVTIDLSQEISLKSALNLILQELNLCYVVKDEVLKITSAHSGDSEVYTNTYNVADLVIPIPNFRPTGNMGLAGALADAQGRAGMNWGAGMGGGSPMPVMAANNGNSSNFMTANDLLAQVNSPGLNPTPSAGGQPLGSGPGGAGGGAQPDFDALIELITGTIQPDSWDEAGGAGAIQEFEGNLSLVISQTQEVHEEIADLLEQLRRLQDLQVTIEVRFITLNDNFFERIGVDFDFDINDDADVPFQIFGNKARTQAQFASPSTANTGPARNVEDRDLNTSQAVTVGLGAPGVFSADLDIPFAQGNFPLAVPQFGGFQPGAGAQLGFAILSDLETYFFIEAAQGDRRSNVLQAPKVTLFNGQQAFVSDTSQSPFVISVIPVVGDFAAAQMPVIVVLNQGTHLTVQAVVSSDRRFVRLTVVPFFSRITDVNTFRFTGADSTTEESSSEGPDDATDKKGSKKTSSSEGTTVQLPTFSFVTVTTTVSVPDGGTVLLGGIKRLSEGRNEFGVPILNKLPYINRLFRNVGIGRETQSLMMMVTPRIIIQEEEEALLGIPSSP